MEINCALATVVAAAGHVSKLRRELMKDPSIPAFLAISCRAFVFLSAVALHTCTSVWL